MDLFPALTSAAGYALGGPTGALIGAQIGGGISANEARADVAAQANAFSASQYASRYQTQVKDMEAAGLNPMLAYMQSPGSSPTGQQYQVSNPYEGLGQTYSSAYNVERTGKNIEAETELKGTQAKLNEAQIEQVNKSVEKMSSEIRNLDTDNERMKALIDNLREERQNLVKQGWNLTEQGNMLRATVEKLKVEVPEIRSREFLNAARMELAKIETELKRLDLTSAQKFDNFGRDAAQLRPILDVFKALVRPR